MVGERFWLKTPTIWWHRSCWKSKDRLMKTTWVQWLKCSLETETNCRESVFSKKHAVRKKGLQSSGTFLRLMGLRNFWPSEQWHGTINPTSPGKRNGVVFNLKSKKYAAWGSRECTNVKEIHQVSQRKSYQNSAPYTTLHKRINKTLPFITFYTVDQSMCTCENNVVSC